MFVLKVLVWIKDFVLSFLRFGVISGATLAGVLYLADGLLKPELGITNVYITIFICSFFPLLTGLTVEIYCRKLRKAKRKKKNETSFLKETLDKKPLTR